MTFLTVYNKEQFLLKRTHN